MLWGDRRLRRSHGLTKRGDRLDGGIRAGERRVEKGAGGGEEASGATEEGHCDSRSECSWPENLGSEGARDGIRNAIQCVGSVE